jgi:hypothetical protein
VNDDRPVAAKTGAAQAEIDGELADGSAVRPHLICCGFAVGNRRAGHEIIVPVLGVRLPTRHGAVFKRSSCPVAPTTNAAIM